jgi:hypothetical protein
MGSVFCSFLVELGLQLSLTKWFIVQAKILIPTIELVSMWNSLFFCHFPLGRSNFFFKKGIPMRKFSRLHPNFTCKGQGCDY